STSRRLLATATPGWAATGTGRDTTGTGRAATGRRTAPGTSITVRASSGKATAWSITAATGRGRAATATMPTTAAGARWPGAPVLSMSRAPGDPRRRTTKHGVAPPEHLRAAGVALLRRPGATNVARPSSIARWSTGRPSTGRWT